MPGVQKNTSFPLWSKIRKPSGFCGIFKVSKRDLALTFALSRSDAMLCNAIERGMSIVLFSDAEELNGEHHLSASIYFRNGLRLVCVNCRLRTLVARTLGQPASPKKSHALGVQTKKHGDGSANAVEPPNYDLPARGKSHPINFSYGSRRNFWDGSRRLRWNSFCWTAFLAKAATCSSVCRFSFGSAIHWRIIFRRVSWSAMFAIP